MGRPKGSKNKPKVVEKPTIETIIEPVVCKEEVKYILACDWMMPASYTKFLCKENNRWLVCNDYEKDFLELFPDAKLQN